MVAKSFLRKQVPTKNFHQKCFGRNFVWSQNHFLENRFLPKIFINNFLVETFYGRKIISSKTGSYQKFSSKIFWSKIFMVAKLFPRKQVPTKNVHQIFFGRKFLRSQNLSLENRFLPKIFINNSLVKIFCSRKIISSKTV